MAERLTEAELQRAGLVRVSGVLVSYDAHEAYGRDKLLEAVDQYNKEQADGARARK